jgi:hypothetical protein
VPGERFASRRATAGLTLIEVLLATLIAGTMLVAATTALTGSVKAQQVMMGDPVTAFGLAREIHSAAQLLPRTPGDGVPATTGAEVVTLDDLDDATFSPPLSARLASLTGSAGWSQEVHLEHVNLTTPGILAEDPETNAALLRLTVTVRQGAEVAGTYIWWLNS